MLPQDFLEEMKALLGAEYDEFINSYDKERLQALRLNTLKSVSFEKIKEDFGLKEVEWAEEGFYYNGKMRPGKNVYHEAGAYYIQEPSAMAPGEYLGARPGEYILDLCAAPGGKSTQIAAAMKGEGILISNEIVPSRARILSENIERMGIKNAVVTNMDPHDLAEHFTEFFDRIMVDAPCSGEGMFRKNETAVSEWSRDNVHMCAERQDDIMECAASMLCPGGRIVYSTCTFSVEENEGTVERFLNNHPDFHVAAVKKYEGMEGGFGKIKDAIRIFPHKSGGEGHFLCVLEREGLLPEKEDRLSGGKLAKGIKEKAAAEYTEFAQKYLNTLPEGVMIKFGDMLYMLPKGCPSLDGLKVVRPGLHLGENKKGRFEPAHALSRALKLEDFKYVAEIDYKDAVKYIEGQTFTHEGENGWYLVETEGFGLSWGKLAAGTMKNHYPKGLRKTQLL